MVDSRPEEALDYNKSRLPLRCIVERVVGCNFLGSQIGCNDHCVVVVVVGGIG